MRQTSDDPDQWYREALERKHQAELRSFVVGYWLRRLFLVALLIALAVIAWKL